jgi:hypothetical protein
MTAPSSPVPGSRPRILAAVLTGGLVAGSIDAGLAFHSFGWTMPKGIAAGLLGKEALTGGPGVWILGLTLHFAIAFASAAIYCAAGRKLDFLRSSFVICGIAYGACIFLVMNLVVLPLSAFPFPVGPFTVSDLRGGLLVHMFLIGLPISAAFRLLSKSRPT